ATFAPASAQSVKVKLFSKAVGDDVLVAIQIRPSYGCWVYDQGDPSEVGGLPTTVTLGELGGAEWTEVWFPEAKVKPDEGFGPARVFDKKTYLFAAARGAASAGVDAGAVGALVAGQVCDENQCLKFEEDLQTLGAGPESVWEGFPESLLAQPEEDPLEWSPDFGDEAAAARAFARVLDGDDSEVVELVVQVATPEHWHMYHGPTAEDMGPGIGTPTTVTVEGGNVDWEDDVHYPEPFRYVQDASDQEKGWLWAHEGLFHFALRGEAFDEFDPGDLVIGLDGQSCDDGACLPVNFAGIEVVGAGSDALFAAAFAKWTLPQAASGGAGAATDPGAGPDAGSGNGTDTDAGADAETDAVVGAAESTPTIEAPAADGEKRSFGQETESEGLLRFILIAIGAGLFTLLMPCTYPMIPITISFFTKQADEKGGNALLLASFYGLGIVAMFVLLGVVAGKMLVPFATHPVTNFVIGVLFVVFALALFGAITLNPPAFLMGAAGKASGTGGILGVFLMGLTLVITSFTCTGPFVGTLIATGASGGVMRIVIGMGVFGATMAAPFVVLALIPSRLSAIPSAGGWMNTLKVFMGFVELAAALKFFSNADIALQAGWLPREVFLMMWAAIGLAAAMYLFGRINLKGESPDGEIGPWRLCGGVATLIGSFYCLMGVQGYHLDEGFMSAMAPPPDYSRGLVKTHRPADVAEILDALAPIVAGGEAAVEALPSGVERLDGSLVVKDDYDLALRVARERGLGLLVNFTGHT
ncbi:MAG: protein-disulfide reductase DsbD family protein, partial [Planctomycetota bacterium]